MKQKFRKAYEVQFLLLSFVVIAICETFFIIDVLADIFRIDIDTLWVDHGIIELVSVVFLAIALVAIGLQIRQLLRKHRDAESSVKVASGELLTVIHERFDEWRLTPSEIEIALLLIKGFSAQEIANLRDTRPGTVKSQSSTIYQKAGVRGRNELVAYFVEDLLAGERITETV